MSFLKVTIPGDYWDVQIYRGKLYLWTMFGSLVIVNWGKLIDSIAQESLSPLAVRMGFAEGDALYQLQGNRLFWEDQFRDWLRLQFDRQAEEDIVVDDLTMRRSTFDIIDNPLGGLPIDTEVYNQTLYATTETGLWNVSIDELTDEYTSPDPVKLHDVSAVSVRAKSNQLALAASDYGLFRVDLNVRPEEHEVAHVSERPCDRAEWSFQSIFADSLLDGGYLVSRYWRDIVGKRPQVPDYRIFDDRELVDGETYDTSDIVGTLAEPAVSWALAEKIYTANETVVTSTKYTQQRTAKGMDAASKELGRIQLGGRHGRALSGRAAVSVLLWSSTVVYT